MASFIQFLKTLLVKVTSMHNDMSDDPVIYLLPVFGYAHLLCVVYITSYDFRE